MSTLKKLLLIPLFVVCNMFIGIDSIHALPSGYTQVQYLQSNGSQWINTGIVKYKTNTYRLASKVLWNGVSSRQVHGCQDYFYYGVVSGYLQMTQSGNNHTSVSISANTAYDIDAFFDTTNSKVDYSVNGQSYTMSTIYSNSLDGKSFAIFSLNDNVLPFGTSRVYYYTLYRNGTLVFDGIPARRNSDNVLGMYDNVSGNFYTNAGSGSFTAGPDVVSVSVTVTYACGDGTGNEPSQASATSGSSFTPAANTCTPPNGKVFTGWLVSGTSDIKPAGTAFTWSYTENKTLTAQYASTYTVTYACGDGTGNAPTDSNSPYISGSTVTTLSNTCTVPSGSRFSKWNCGGTNVNAGSTFTISANTTCTAQYDILCGQNGVINSGFTKLSYIAADTSGKYINTGYTPRTSNLSGSVSAMPTADSVHADIIGSNSLSIGYGGYFYFWIQNRENLIYNTPWTIGTLYDIDFSTTSSGRTLTVNGSTVSDSVGFSSTGELRLFCNILDYFFVGRIYGLQLYDNSELVLDLIPVKRDSDNVVGMCNTVNGNFLTNAGSGSFTAGPVAANYTVTYACGSGTGTAPTDSNSPYASGSTVTTLSNTCTPPNGQVFSKWSCGGTNVNAGSTFTISANITCTAQYASTYTVTYACGSGTGTAPTDSNSPYASGSTVTTLSNTCTVPSGSRFSKWNCGGTNVNAGSTFTISANTTCTAQYVLLTGDCGIPSLDTSIYQAGRSTYAYQNANGGTSRTNPANYGITTNNTWAVEFSYGTVWGVANCNSVNGFAQESVATITPENSGIWCWCQATGFTASGNDYTSGPRCTTSASNTWAFNIMSGGSDAEDCANNCVYYCAIQVGGDESYRESLFGAVPTGLMCSSGTYLPANSSTCTTCPSGYVCPGGTFNTGVQSDQGKYYGPAFSVTTSATNEFLFDLSAQGAFYVDCGTGGTLSSDDSTANAMISGGTITKNDTTKYTFKCSYSNSAIRTIQFGGTATNYSGTIPTATISFSDPVDTNKRANAAKITAVSGDLSAIFPYISANGANGAQPQFYCTFGDAVNLQSVPGTLFSGYTTGCTYMFYGTFRSCTNLTTIPSSLFSNITTGAFYMFYNTFGGSGLTSIPSGLFSNITTGAQRMFEGTFMDTNITSIPSNLFSGITTGASYMFRETFYNCDNLTGYIPPTLFDGLIKNNAGTGTFYDTFDSTGMLTSCPSGTTQYATNYTSAWGGKVSCIESIFSVTTSATNEFLFDLSAQGTFGIDCGTGGTLSSDNSTANAMISGGTITKNDTTNYTFKCSYSNSAIRTIGFGGTATNYNTDMNTAAMSFYVSNSTANAAKITAISGDLSAIFPYMSANAADGAQPRFSQMFYGANITSIPNTLFSGYTRASTHMFAWTFRWCTRLTTIPSDLFANITNGADSAFLFAFASCTSLTSLPSGLFAGFTTGGASMFSNAFIQCTSLTTIPSNLFANLTTGADFMFNSTFSMTGLTSIPSGLFSNITTSAPHLFDGTFSGTPITTIPSNLFSGITTGAGTMFGWTFADCPNLTTIPSGLFSNITTSADSMFRATFMSCPRLTTIPSNLFGGITTGANRMFYQTFFECTRLTTIPSGLFSNITTSASEMFFETFQDCTSLTTIPSGLFSGITTGVYALFNRTFTGCTSLTTIPSNLFANITTGQANSDLFSSTFSGCTSLTGYIPPTLFDGIIKNNVTPGVFSGTFSNTGMDTSCPSGMVQYAVDYTSYWGGKVSCEAAPAVNLTWYDGDSTISGPSSCTVGGTFLPPTPAPRPGYIFTGWKAHVGECGIWRLDRSIDGTAYSYQTNYGTGGSSVSNYGITTADTWAVEFNYGTIWGKSRCSTTSGSSHSLTWPSNSQSDWLNTPADDNGRYCWCQVTGFTAAGNSYTSGPACTTAMSSLWVHNYGDSGEVDCAANCAPNCAAATKSYTEFRTALFGAVGQ